MMFRGNRFALVLTLVLFLAPAPAQAQSQSQSLADLDWISGGWRTVSDGGKVTEEHWTPAAGPKMFGISRTFRDGAPKSYEHVCIESRPDGIFYLAMPNGRAPATEFRMTRCEAHKVVFENPTHDFPKTIVYELLDSTTLRATAFAGDSVAEWTMHKIR